MNKITLLSVATFMATTLTVNAQDKKSVTEDYMRSSLYTIIIDDHGILDEKKSEIVKNTFFTTPLPDKFNDHNLSEALRSFKPADYAVTDAEVEAMTEGGAPAKKKSAFGKGLGQLTKEVTSSVTLGIVDTTDTRKISAQFMKFFNEEKIANKIIAKWFNQGETYIDSSFFKMDLIAERGLYNATEISKEIAKNSVLGNASLADAGANLIGNTFVVGVRFNYVNKEDMAKQLAGPDMGILGDAVAVVGKGYIIKATAYLFQLDWSDEVSKAFYDVDYKVEDLSKFTKSDKYKLKLVGSETAWADVQSTTFSKVSEEDLVKRATVRSIDNVIAKLQRKFEAFRTKTPLLTTTPAITAQIGMKENLAAGDKYEVLEKTQDPETNIVKYKRVAVIKVEKNKIWDNRFGAAEEQAENAANNAGEVQNINATTFSGNAKNIYPGMLIRQIN